MVVDQVSPRSDRTHISGKLTLQQKQSGCQSKLSGTLERDMFLVCQSLETWPMIALESLLSRGYFLAQLSLFVKSVDMTFSYFATCCTFNLYLTLFAYLQVWIVSLHCDVWKVVLSAQWQTARVLLTIFAVHTCIAGARLFFVFVVEEYICCSYIVWKFVCTHCKERFLSVVQDDLVLDVRRDCLRIQSVCEDLSVVVSYILSSPHFDVLISKNKLTPQPQFPLFFSFCQNSVEQKLTHTYSFHIWIVVTSYSYEWSH